MSQSENEKQQPAERKPVDLVKMGFQFNPDPLAKMLTLSKKPEYAAIANKLDRMLRA